MPIQAIKDELYFFANDAKNIQTKTIDRLGFCCAISLPKTGNRINNPAPRFLFAPLYGKTVFTGAVVIVNFYGATRPAPATSPKEQITESGTFFSSQVLRLHFIECFSLTPLLPATKVDCQ